MPYIAEDRTRHQGFTSRARFSLNGDLCAEEVHLRRSRAPDCKKENRALTKLAGALGGSPSNILQTLVETILEVTGCDSVVLGLPSKSDHRNRFYCAAAAGVWGARLGRETPSDFGVNWMCWIAIMQSLLRDLRPGLLRLPPGLAAMTECLLAALCVRGEVVGRVWAIMHSSRRMFDAEDERLVIGLVRFAALAYQSAASIEDLEREMIAREKSEVRMRGLD